VRPEAGEAVLDDAGAAHAVLASQSVSREEDTSGVCGFFLGLSSRLDWHVFLEADDNIFGLVGCGEDRVCSRFQMSLRGVVSRSSRMPASYIAL
jgi:hypothetical protein